MGRYSLQGDRLTDLAAPTASTDGARYGDTVGTQTWREIILDPSQLVGGGAAYIAPAVLAYFSHDLSNGDTVVLSDGTHVETYTAAAGMAAFQFICGGGAAATATNLIANIVANSAWWTSVALTIPALSNMFTGSPATIGAIRRKSAGSGLDRIYSTTMSFAGSVKVISFAGMLDYGAGVAVDVALPTSDPVATNFGFGRAFAALRRGEMHPIVSTGAVATWNPDAQAWTQNAARTGAGGALTSANTTFVSATDLTVNLAAGQKIMGQAILFANDAGAAGDGLKFDFNGGTATWTSFEYAFVATPVGATLGVSSGLAIATALTATTVATTDSAYMIAFAGVVNAAGTLIPRFAKNSGNTGNANLAINSSITISATSN